MVSIGFLIGLLCAYWIWSDSRSRGSDFGNSLVWTLGTFFAWYLFVPMYFLFGRKKKKAPVKAADDVIDVDATVVEEDFHCNMCGKDVKTSGNKCPNCGHTLRPTCEHCGREVDRYWKNCPYCHKPIQPM
ncbi:MAG: zinc ribbon domain-containing protein [Sporomusaceae bacterium]|nr:zinc ribbon domain-containing protein [Sporomusaceae bacterium]